MVNAEQPAVSARGERCDKLEALRALRRTGEVQRSVKDRLLSMFI